MGRMISKISSTAVSKAAEKSRTIRKEVCFSLSLRVDGKIWATRLLNWSGSFYRKFVDDHAKTVFREKAKTAKQ